MINKISTNLYRYDLCNPPESWDSDFLNFEYETKEYGHKNKANLFFFTDSEDIAKDLGTSAAYENSLNEYFLTETIPCMPLNLIDFSNSYHIYQMLCVLSDLNINVLTKDFRTYEEENTFERLKQIFDNAELESDKKIKTELITQLNLHTHSNYEDISLFGQRLTDFENGIKFKALVKADNSEIDGYRWREFNDNRGFSYCLFDSKKLTQKKTQKIAIDKAFIKEQKHLADLGLDEYDKNIDW